jgi:transcriptional regulator with XRE-family HTH domain
MSIGAKIKSRRNELGLTQGELAALVGLKNKSSISLIEKGQGDLSQSAILKFADALDCDPLWLLDIEDHSHDLSWADDSYCAEAAQFLFIHKEYRKLFDLLREIPADKLDRVQVALELMI